MKTIEYFKTSRHPNVGDENSPWYNEPDKVQWEDEVTKFPCLAVRNNIGAWCGYVGVDESHPLYRQGYSRIEIEVHGGLTFSDHCHEHGEGEEGNAICHLPEEGEPDNVWWFGFDCGHYLDKTPYDELPFMVSFANREKTYRTLEYVKEQCRMLALHLQSNNYTIEREVE